MTNRELLYKAMPLQSLSDSEWELLRKHFDRITDKAILSVLKKLQINQARLEIIGNYYDYYSNTLDTGVPEASGIICI